MNSPRRRRPRRSASPTQPPAPPQYQRRTEARPSAPAPKQKPRPPPRPAGPLHWRDALPALLAEPNYQPLDERALLRRLHIAPEEVGAFTASPRTEGEAGRVMQARQS